MIDLRVAPRPEIQVEELATLHDLLGKEAFPQVNKQMTSTINVAPEPGELVGSSHATGWLFRSADKTEVVQAQREGFAYSRLAPYVSWEDLLENARRRWRQYSEVAKPTHVKRLAVRYINRLHLPLPILNFQDWVHKFPDVPASLPQGVAEVFQRIVIPIPGPEQLMAIVTLGLEPYVPNGKLVVVIFDIDISRVAAWEPEGEQLWLALAALRGIKNDFFFSYLSPMTLELFK